MGRTQGGARFAWLLLPGMVLICVGQPALAYHRNAGRFGTAMTPCLAAAASAATPGGVPACCGENPQSDCASDPARALRLSAAGRTRFVVRPIDARIPGYSSEEDARLSLRGVEDCTGQPWTGETTMSLVLRLTVRDPACVGGICTVPDLEIPHHPVECNRGICSAHLKSTPLLAALGLPPLPTDVPWSAECLSLTLLDRAGKPFLSPALVPSRSASHQFVGKAADYKARLVPAFGPCPAAAVDSTTSAGLGACGGVRPLSDCTADPARAVAFRFGGRRSKVALSRQGRESIGFEVVLDGLGDCTQGWYDGTVTLAVTVRATFGNPSPAGGLCTTVDTPLRASVAVRRGRATQRGELPLALLGTRLDGLEVVRVEVRDASDRPILAAPGLNVTCNARVCYGN